MRVLVASSSYYRQTCYRQWLTELDHEVAVASGGVECLQQLRRSPPELLVLEAPLLWGGSDGVLAAILDEVQLADLPIVVICASQGNLDWFRLSQFRVDDFLVRVPTRDELALAIERCDLACAARAGGPRSYSNVAAALPISAGPFSPGGERCPHTPSARC